MLIRLIILICFVLLNMFSAKSQPIFYSVEYGEKPTQPPSLVPIFNSSYLGFENVYVVRDNWYYASRERADSINADAFLIPGGSTSDVPFYDGSLDSYVKLLQNPGRPALGFCAGIQFLLMARGGICAPRSGERGNQTATIFEWDEIFDGCPNPYIDRAAHTFSIADMPDCYRNLATTRLCYVTFARHITMPLYGTQLHVESMSNPNTAGPAVIGNFRNRIMSRKFHGVAEVIGFPGEPGKVLVTWWQAKTDSAVSYQIFYAQNKNDLDYQLPQFETTALEYAITGLNHDSIYYFAVRARCSAFVDSNTAVFPIKPDGHREIVFQNGKAIDGQGYDNCEATVIYDAYPNSNYGQRGAPGRDELYWWNSGLVQFKGLEQYLAGKKIIGGKLTFIFVGGVTDQTNDSHVADMSIYRILKPWNEGIGIYHAQARIGEVTWNSAQHGVLSWEVAGCKGNSDRVPEPIASYTIKGDGTGIAFDGTVQLPPDLIQTWVDFPDSNCGLLYEKVDSYPNNQYFYFEDNDDEWFMNHPRLTVYYLDESGAPVAEVEFKHHPASFSLGQNYPNPFNQATVIPIELKKTQHVKITIYNIEGRLVSSLFDGTLNSGVHKFSWDGRAENGSMITSGVYLYSLQTGKEQSVRRMVLIR